MEQKIEENLKRLDLFVPPVLDETKRSKLGGALTLAIPVSLVIYGVYLVVQFVNRPSVRDTSIVTAEGLGTISLPITCTFPYGCRLDSVLLSSQGEECEGTPQKVFGFEETVNVEMCKGRGYVVSQAGNWLLSSGGVPVFIELSDQPSGVCSVDYNYYECDCSSVGTDSSCKSKTMQVRREMRTCLSGTDFEVFSGAPATRLCEYPMTHDRNCSTGVHFIAMPLSLLTDDQERCQGDWEIGGFFHGGGSEEARKGCSIRFSKKTNEMFVCRDDVYSPSLMLLGCSLIQFLSREDAESRMESLACEIVGSAPVLEVLPHSSPYQTSMFVVGCLGTSSLIRMEKFEFATNSGSGVIQVGLTIEKKSEDGTVSYQTADASLQVQYFGSTENMRGSCLLHAFEEVSDGERRFTPLTQQSILIAMSNGLHFETTVTRPGSALGLLGEIGGFKGLLESAVVFILTITAKFFTHRAIQAQPKTGENGAVHMTTNPALTVL